MALPTLDVLDKDGLPVTVNTLQSGRSAAADSSSAALSTEDKASLDALARAAYNSVCTITRPANTTPYSINDSVGGALTFASAGPSAGGTIIITGAQLELDISAIPSGMTSFRLHLYNVTPPSATADNGAWDLPSGDRASYLGYVDLGTPVDLGSTCYVEQTNLVKQIATASGSIYGYLVTPTAYTPAANSEVYKITLHTMGI